ncbi:hypothetical protein JCM19298_1945 [Nonlabens ulvanivorans]|nr:hypothetical protein [Nonlabens ulvanivorans]GAK93226.1 hypothetical protein JCM19298_1945 [Nonlabens ulvanivorans]|tara:strand:- start:117 stop:704 length:588 start_codon:yes stop_codon:yes gene_type:complete
MKKMILLMAAGLMMMTTAQANEVLVNQDNLQGELTRYRNAQPVLFALNNVDYAVFPDGRVEFELPNTRQSYGNSNNYRRYDTNRRSSNRSSNRNFVSYNRKGQVTKIGNTRISYFASGQVARIGHLNMDYTRRGGVLNQVGGLEVRYNRNGKLIAARGQVNLRERLTHNQDFGHFPDDNHDDWDDGVFFKRGTTD